MPLKMNLFIDPDKFSHFVLKTNKIYGNLSRKYMVIFPSLDLNIWQSFPLYMATFPGLYKTVLEIYGDLSQILKNIWRSFPDLKKYMEIFPVIYIDQYYIDQIDLYNIWHSFPFY